jgi:H+/Cl- antiporter ClcA
MDNKFPIGYWNMFFFFLTWYLLTITTYGTFVPSGLFLPGMIIGCALGELIFLTMDYSHLIIGDDDTKNAINKNYIVIACAGFMAGYTRMTYSLAVIIMETSNDIQIFLPIMITITVSNYTAYFFTRSLYERAIRGK